MSVSRLPTYRHHKPSAQAVVTLNGRDHYLGPWQSRASRNEYDRLIGEWLANGRRLPQDQERGDFRVCELLNAYRKFAEIYYRSGDGNPGKEFVCMEAVIKPLKDRYSRTRVADFGPLALKSIRQEMVDKGLCRTHINQRVNRIRRIFKWGVENELAPPEVLHALQAVAPLRFGRSEARESKPVQPVADEHVDAILPFVSRPVAAMIELQRLTGARPGEIVRMRPMDVDRTDEIWIYRPFGHKTAYRGHKREIFLGPKAQEVLAPWLLREEAARCFSPKEAEAERNEKRRLGRQSPMTPSQAARVRKKKPKRPKRDSYDVSSFGRAIKYAIAMINAQRELEELPPIPSWHLHQLRHACGTRLRRLYGLDVAQIILGHRSAQVTEVYAEADRARAIQVMRGVG